MGTCSRGREAPEAAAAGSPSPAELSGPARPPARLKECQGLGLPIVPSHSMMGGLLEFCVSGSHTRFGPFPSRPFWVPWAPPCGRSLGGSEWVPGRLIPTGGNCPPAGLRDCSRCRSIFLPPTLGPTAESSPGHPFRFCVCGCYHCGSWWEKI